MALGDTEYNGTLSTLTRYGTMLTSHQRTQGKLMRGKVKCNKAQPRTYGPASECVSYYLDEDGNKVNGKVFKVARERNVSKVKQHSKGVSLPETAKVQSKYQHDYNS